MFLVFSSLPRRRHRLPRGPYGRAAGKGVVKSDVRGGSRRTQTVPARHRRRRVDDHRDGKRVPRQARRAGGDPPCTAERCRQSARYLTGDVSRRTTRRNHPAGDRPGVHRQRPPTGPITAVPAAAATAAITPATACAPAATAGLSLPPNRGGMRYEECHARGTKDVRPRVP